MQDDAKARLGVVEKIIRLVRERHFNLAAVNYDEWESRFREREAALVGGDRDEFEACIRTGLSELKTSHTTFYSESPTRFPPQHTIGATLLETTVNACRHWMFLDVFESGPACQADMRPGDLLTAVDGIETVPGNLPVFGIGRSHSLIIVREGRTIETTISVPARKGSQQRPPIVEPVSIVHRTLAPGVGFLKVLYFPGALGIRFSNELSSRIADLKEKGCDRLIIDLRGNIGGSLGFAALASYLCAGRDEIGYSLTPGRLRSGHSVQELPRVRMPRTRSDALVRLAAFAARDKSLMLLAQGLGPQPFHSRTVVMVNEWTSSAGEMAAAFAADSQTAVVLGSRTKGNVLGAANFRIGERYWLRLPVFGWFTPTGQCLEGKGITPAISSPVLTSQDARNDLPLREALRTIQGM